MDAEKTEAHISALLGGESVEGDRALAANSTTPADILEALSKSRDASVRQQVAANPNTPIAVLWKLGAEFPEYFLKNPIVPLLCLEFGDVIAAIPEDTLFELCSCEIPDCLYQPLLNPKHQHLIGEIARCSGIHKSLLERLLQDFSDYLDLRINLARNPSTPAFILARLAADRAPVVRDAVASNSSNPIEILQKLAENGDSLTRDAIASNESTPIALLHQLANDSTSLVRRAVARHYQAPREVLHHLAADSCYSVRLTVAKNLHAHPKTLRQLGEETGIEMRRAVAKHPHTPADTIRALGRERDAEVRFSLARHRYTTAAMLQQLAWESNAALLQDFARITAREPRKNNYSVPVTENRDITALVIHCNNSESDRNIRGAVAQNRNTSPLTLEQLAGDNDDRVRWAVASREAEVVSSPQTFLEILKQLSRDRDLSVREAVAKHPYAPVEALECLARDESSNIRAHVAQHKNTPVEVLRQLARDRSSLEFYQSFWSPGLSPAVELGIASDEYVRGAVAKNPNTPTDAIAELAADSMDCIRYAILYNQSITEDILQYLTRDSHSAIAAAAVKRIRNS
ncbi:hypothetical protein [Oscillatoria sp. FACHB-1406]|uniref:hypothetical protein n=1 Tax=Oscillatoria sp. FACHB-1406 TaxID=2692846 RepID=UPI001686AE8D|nr:hypothetical protein [Oscillatoria sp. FACHB-1406]MBD2577996.1 hypothetical protein [Oscillatoria sp. FACHB-1406]